MSTLRVIVTGKFERFQDWKIFWFSRPRLVASGQKVSSPRFNESPADLISVLSCFLLTYVPLSSLSHLPLLSYSHFALKLPSSLSQLIIWHSLVSVLSWYCCQTQCAPSLLCVCVCGGGGRTFSQSRTIMSCYPTYSPTTICTSLHIPQHHLHYDSIPGPSVQNILTELLPHVLHLKHAYLAQSVIIHRERPLLIEALQV